MKNPTLKTLLWVTMFSIAMGYLEASVVVYLRALYYPEGFAFPLKVIAYDLAVTEVFRECATMLMLLGIGIIAGRTKTEKFACFIYSFATWDIFYYVFLKVLLNWPESLFTWDILFVLPTIWVGPVLAPVINSLTMIVLALVILSKTSANRTAGINRYEWALLILGSLVVIAAYTMEYAAFMTLRFAWKDIFALQNYRAVQDYAAAFIPRSFNWPVFSAGVLMHGAAIVMLYQRREKRIPVKPE